VERIFCLTMTIAKITRWLDGLILMTMTHFRRGMRRRRTAKMTKLVDPVVVVVAFVGVREMDVVAVEMDDVVEEECADVVALVTLCLMSTNLKPVHRKRVHLILEVRVMCSHPKMVRRFGKKSVLENGSLHCKML